MKALFEINIPDRDDFSEQALMHALAQAGIGAYVTRRDDLLKDSLKALQSVSEYFLLSKDPRWIGSRASGLVLETLDKLVAFEEKK